jgi:hypothetical protein
MKALNLLSRHTPGLTRLRGRSPFGAAKARVSIMFAKGISKGMDGRVKPGHDTVGDAQPPSVKIP